jgi:hypothetical protein
VLQHQCRLLQSFGRATEYAARRRHQQGGRHALIRHIADHDPQPAGGQLDHIVEVAADRPSRLVVGRERPSRRMWQCLRQQRLLDAPRRPQLLLDLLLRLGSRVLLAYKLRHASGHADELCR